MGVLSEQIISEFVKVTNDIKREPKEETLYGTVIHQGGDTYVRFDGSELLTPVSKTTATSNNDRVVVSLKNHNATIIGNITDPSAGNAIVGNISANLDKIGVNDLVANNINVNQKLNATEASIEELTTNKLDVNDAKIHYADINFANIKQAAFEKFYANSGLIQNVVVGNQTITGDLVGVTISGDLIKANTLKADKLVIKGKDGLYYQLNTDGEKIETQQTNENSLNGSLIQAKSIVANKIDVKDLTAFGATIGGIHITGSSLYSGVKTTIDNSTDGIYLDSNGQINIGNSNSFIKFYLDKRTNNHRLEIAADSLKFVSSNQTLESELETIHNQMGQIKEEIATVLKIESSKGTVFKNNNISTVLSVVIYRGSKRIVDAATLKAEFGVTAKLTWSWQRLNENTFGDILDTDPRITNGGFLFSVTNKDVNTKTTFKCTVTT